MFIPIILNQITMKRFSFNLKKYFLRHTFDILAIC